MKIQELLFSIIIPVYNTPYENLKNVIGSVLNQKENSYELLLIDDGSKKECHDYIDELSLYDSRIRVIHQVNGGVSSARNNGIKEALGKYIIFADADDIISENMFLEAKEYIEKYNPDIIFGRMVYIPERETFQNNTNVDFFFDSELKEINKCLLDIEPRKIKYKILGTPCGRVYRTSLVQANLFEEGVPFCEDQLFNRKMLKASNNAMVVPNAWYYYVQNNFSAMHGTLDRDYFKMVKPFWDSLIYYNRLEDSDIQEALHVQSLGLLYSGVRSNYVRSIKNIFTKRKKIKEMASHELIQSAIKYLSSSRVYMNKSQKIGYYLTKYHFYFLIYILHRGRKNN